MLSRKSLTTPFRKKDSTKDAKYLKKFLKKNKNKVNKHTKTKVLITPSFSIF